MDESIWSSVCDIEDLLVIVVDREIDGGAVGGVGW